MATNSVNTNAGALVALQNLNATNTELAQTQNRISTGKRVLSAKDNGAIWAIAQSQKATSNSLNAVISSLQRGSSVIDVSLAAAAGEVREQPVLFRNDANSRRLAGGAARAQGDPQ